MWDHIKIQVMAQSMNNNNNVTCFICGKPSIRSYPLKKCTACENLIHRCCTQTPTGKDVFCGNCLSLEAKTKKKSGNSDTPPSNINVKGSASKRPQGTSMDK